MNQKNSPKTHSISTREYQLILARILKSFTDWLDEHDIRYTLAGGTLLGAIRHKGFIPWDDDVDISISRPDFEKLQEIKSLDVKDNLIICNKANNSSYPFIKICDPRYPVQENYLNTPNNQHAWLDVFPVDGLPKSKLATKIHYAKVIFLRKLLCQRLLYKGSTRKSAKTKLKSIFKPITKKFVDLLPASYYANTIDKLSKKYDYATSDFVGNVVWGYGPQEKLKKQDFENKTAVLFEKNHYSAIASFDSHLSNIYGDYMQLPPEKDRKTHNIVIRDI